MYNRSWNFGKTLLYLIQEKNPEVKLKLKKPKNDKKLKWTQDTIDNEHMNKKKSKCNFPRFNNIRLTVVYRTVLTKLIDSVHSAKC